MKIFNGHSRSSKIEQLEENLKSTELLPLLDESIQKELLLI